MKINKAGFTLIELLLVLAVLAFFASALFSAIEVGKSSRNAQPQSASGVQTGEVKGQANPKGQTTTIQQNLRGWFGDDKVGHLYVFSAYSGQVIVHSTVRGRVTPHGNRVGDTQFLSWVDTNGASHEHYMSDRQIIHVSGVPLAVKGDVLATEATPQPEANK